MKVHPNKIADIGRVRRPHAEKPQYKKVTTRSAAESHKSHVENLSPNIILPPNSDKQISARSCICGFYRSSPTLMRIHKNICNQYLSSNNTPVQQNKSLATNTEPSISPHSLSGSNSSDKKY